ncbi:hypothetical protein T439DRAFT_178902 [Meredithblackwellia eburnea MCA 4105]
MEDMLVKANHSVDASSGSVGSPRRSLSPLSATAPAKRKRRRKMFSCVACHNLKSKCDREAPCSRCVQRGIASTCSLVEGNEDNSGTAGSTTALAPSLALPLLPPGPSTIQLPFSQPVSMEPLLSYASQPPPTFTSMPPPPKRPAPSKSTAPSSSSASLNGISPVRTGPPPHERSSGSGSGEEEGDEEEHAGIGTLLLDDDGRERFIGATAGSEWLKENDANDVTRPTFSQFLTPGDGNNVEAAPSNPAFPFSPAGQNPRNLNDALQDLPDIDEAKMLAECYFRYVTWNYDVIARPVFEKHMNEIYDLISSHRLCDIHPHRLAVLFAVLAVGVQFNLEVEVGDPLAARYRYWAETCLSIGDFMRKNSLVGVQALHVLGQFSLSVDRKGDSSWGIWGLCLTQSQAMGLHRDGEAWGLPEAAINERRLIFWENYAMSICQGNNFARPNMILPDFFDAKFPFPEVDAQGIDTFLTLKYKFTKISALILQEVTKVKPSRYRTIQELWKTLHDFELNIPYHYRCKPAWTAIASLGESATAQKMDCPAIQKHNFKLTQRQHTLAMNIGEAVLSLQRPFFTRALFQSSRSMNLTESRFYPSVIAVFERCLALVAILRSLCDLYPLITNRHWSYYYHCFSAAVCFNTLVILAPSSHLAPIALREISYIIDVFSTTPPGSRQRENLNALLRMQQRAQERFSAQSPPPTTVMHQISSALGLIGDTAMSSVEPEEGEEGEEHVAMVGWNTRLVRRLKSGVAHSAKSIHKGSRLVGVSPDASSQTSNTGSVESPGIRAFNVGNSAVDLNWPINNHTLNGNTIMPQFEGDHTQRSLWGQDTTGIPANPDTAAAADDWDFWTELFRDFNKNTETSSQVYI